MRYVAVVLVALVLAACGSSEPIGHTGGGGACAAAVVYHHAMYVKTDAPRPALKGRLRGGYVPACLDHEGSAGTDQAVVLRRIAGMSPSDAVYSRRPFPGVYRRTVTQP